MNRNQRIALVVAAIAAISMVGLAGAVSADTDESNESVAPGERLSGVVGMEQADLDGEIEERSFQSQLATAESDDERAALIAERYDAVDGALNDTDAALAELRDARDNGSITHGQYQAQVAIIDAQSANAERAAQSMSNNSAELPADVLEANGVNVEAIDQLRTNASELGGQEVSEIARSIGGPPADVPAGDDMPGGPPAQNDSPVDQPGADDAARGPPDANDDTPANESPGADNESDRPDDAGGGPPADDHAADGPGQAGSAGQPSSLPLGPGR